MTIYGFNLSFALEVLQTWLLFWIWRQAVRGNERKRNEYGNGGSGV